MDKSLVVLNLQLFFQQFEITVILNGGVMTSLEFPSQPALLAQPCFIITSLSDGNFCLSCHCKLRTTLYLIQANANTPSSSDLVINLAKFRYRKGWVADNCHPDSI
uniref:Uncharacterized protein n=1 Tax=Micrurus spixii TaxID=129469 RepID=A0A2D4MSI9_9SAUR